MKGPFHAMSLALLLAAVPALAEVQPPTEQQQLLDAIHSCAVDVPIPDYCSALLQLINGEHKQ